MEKISPRIIFRRFGFKVFLYNIALLFAVISLLWIVNKQNYKDFMDRMSFQKNFFRHTAEALDGLEKEEWKRRLSTSPGIFFGQCFFLFDADTSLYFENNIDCDWQYGDSFSLLLPHPYAESPADGPALIEYLLSRPGIPERDLSYFYRAVRTVSFDSGLNRIAIMAKRIHTGRGDSSVLVMVADVTDILMQGRAVKERFLFISMLVILLGLGLTLILSHSVTGPFKKLHRYAREITETPWKESDPVDLPKRGEIGEICRTLHGLLQQQQQKSEKFRRFSSDAVHELKTPLAAIRSGLEMLEESTQEEEKSRLNILINRRIGRMEYLMNEIAGLGRLEAPIERKKTKNIPQILAELEEDYKPYSPVFRIYTDLSNLILPLSSGNLRKVLYNLLENATGFSPKEGSVSLTISRDAAFIYFNIQDRGPGIPGEHLGRLTERFYSGRTGKTDGHYGLGLSIVQAVLEPCHGTLSYENRAGGGAAFTVKIPML